MIDGRLTKPLENATHGGRGEHAGGLDSNHSLLLHMINVACLKNETWQAEGTSEATSRVSEVIIIAIP